MSPPEAPDDALARMGRALADPTRCRLVLAIADGAAYPGDLATRLGLSKANVSNHLAYLRDRRVVRATREGRRVRYDIAGPRMRRAIGALAEAAGEATPVDGSGDARATGAPGGAADLALLRRVRDRIDREHARPLDVEALAREVGMSAGHLSRRFRAAYGESPHAYLMTRRIERAMALLRRGDLSVTEVCFAVGCSSLGTFTTRFTELVGMSPGAYRRAGGAPLTGMPTCVAGQVTRPVRNREASASRPGVA